jgi:hypothetical protein
LLKNKIKTPFKQLYDFILKFCEIITKYVNEYIVCISTHKNVCITKSNFAENVAWGIMFTAHKMLNVFHEIIILHEKRVFN